MDRARIVEWLWILALAVLTEYAAAQEEVPTIVRCAVVGGLNEIDFWPQLLSQVAHKVADALGAAMAVVVVGIGATFALKSGPVAYVVTDHELPLVNISIYVRAGDWVEPHGKEGLTDICGHLLTHAGTASRTAQELEERLAFLAAQLSSSIHGAEGSVQLNLLSKDTDEGLTILREVLTAPRFQQDRFDLEKQQMLTEEEYREARTKYGDGSFEADMGAEAVRKLLASQHILDERLPDIQIQRYSRDGDRSLTLQYRQHRGRPLSDAAAEVLRHVRFLWGFPVRLEFLGPNDTVLETRQVA